MMKLTAVLAAVILAVCSAALPSLNAEGSAVPEETADLFDMMGVVQEIAEDAILLTMPDGMEVQVNLFEETSYEGQAPAVGDWIHVTYNGMMTRSLPPQIAALRVACWQLTGVVESLDGQSFLLQPDDGSGQVQVNAEAALMEGIVPGENVTVYYNGIMTMSLPGQISAEWIVGEK